MSKIVVIGSANMDTTHYLSTEFPEDLTQESLNEIVKTVRVLGGKGANQARASKLQSKDAEVYFIGCIGLDKEGNVLANFSIEYPDKTDNKCIKFDDQIFATDMINTCIVDKKDVKEIPCYKKAFDDMVNKIKDQALSENILIKTPVLNYKCYIYTEDLVFLGTTNRLLENSYFNGQYILGEYCGKKLTDYIDEYGDTTKLVIDICINNDITLQLKNVDLLGATSSTMGYALIDTSSARIVRISNTHKSIEYKIPEGLVLPEYKSNFNYDNYYEAFLIGNNPSSIEKFYKLNKVSTNPTIDINRYLIW